MPYPSQFKRRDFIKSLGLGAGALALGGKSALLAKTLDTPPLLRFPVPQLYKPASPWSKETTATRSSSDRLK